MRPGARIPARSFVRTVTTAATAVVLVGLLSTPASARMEISITPASGPVGTSIKVTGSDYGADRVEIFWENDKGEFVLQGEAKVDDNRAFTFTFKAPEGKAGNHKVKVSPKGSTNANNDRTKLFKITTGNKPAGVSIEAGCTGVEHTPLDGNPSHITVGASVVGAPEGAGFHMEIEAPDGSPLPIDSAVDQTGRVSGATGISTFGTYVATEPITIDFTDPNTGQEVSAELDPSTLFPADGFVVGPQEVACDAADLPPGTLLEVTQPPPGGSGTSGSQPPGTESQQPPVQPPVSGGGGGSTVIWFVAIGGGVALVLVGGLVVVGSRKEEADLVHPGWDEADEGLRDIGVEQPELPPMTPPDDGLDTHPPPDGQVM